MIKPFQNAEYTAEGLCHEKIDDSQWIDWEWQMKHRITDIDYIHAEWLTPHRRNRLKEVCLRFPMVITPYYLSLMNLDDPEDPIMKQAIPSESEFVSSECSDSDPLNEEASSPVKGITHRYPDRVLFVLTNICAVYCRHCTRKRNWGDGLHWTLTEKEINQAIHYIQKHPEVRDVLISGGDPLTLPVSLLDFALKRIRQVSHVEIIRIGTRIPVVLPQRIDDALLNVLDDYGPIWLNTQFNHPREITSESAKACDLILRRGIPVSNQTVLLKGINDSPETIKALNLKLLKIKVSPYYLFQCDPVRGTEHFRTSIWKGIDIMEHLRGHTSGLAIPHFVLDLPGGGGKVPLLPNYIISQTRDQITFRNYEGKHFVHHEPHPPHDVPFRTPPCFQKNHVNH